MCCNQKYKGKPENFKACKDRPGLVTFENPVFYRGQKTAPPSHNKLQFVYARKHRPFLAGEYHPVDFFLFAAHHNLNSNVGLIMHPAGNSSDFFHPTNGPAPIPNSLNPAVNLYKNFLNHTFLLRFQKVLNLFKFGLQLPAFFLGFFINAPVFCLPELFQKRCLVNFFRIQMPFNQSRRQ